MSAVLRPQAARQPDPQFLREPRRSAFGADRIGMTRFPAARRGSPAIQYPDTSRVPGRLDQGWHYAASLVVGLLAHRGTTTSLASLNMDEFLVSIFG